MRHAFRVAAVAALLVSGAFGSASAAPTASDRQRAAQSFQIGKAAYARGDFRDAAAAFEQAALYAPHPATMLNAAESWELAENPARAAQLYDRVLDAPVIESQHQQVATRGLAKLERKIGTILVRAPQKARIDVDDREETATKLRVAPGSHKIKMTTSDGETRSETVAVGAGETKDVDFLKPTDLWAKPTESAARKKEEPSASSGPPIGTWASFGGAALAGGVATYFGVKTLDAQKSFDAKPTVAARDEFVSARLSTNIAIGLAAGFVAVGVVLWLVAAPDTPRTRAGTIRAWEGGLLW